MAGWEMDSDAGRRRMAVDEAFLASPHQWPGEWCAVKYQPWVTELPRQFGLVHKDDPLTVIQRLLPFGTGDVTHYPSLQELVKVWSID